MLLYELLVLVSLLDSGVFVLLLSFADDTTSLHDVIVDVALDRFSHASHISLLAVFDLLLNFFPGCFLISLSFLLALIEAVTFHIFRL